MSDAVLITIVTGVVTIITTLGTLILKAKLKGLETKIDGRLTQLLETTTKLAAAEGLAQGKQEGRDEQKSDTKEFKEGEVKIEAVKVDITSQNVSVGEKKPKPKENK